MVTALDYSADAIAACASVLLELMRVLGEVSEHVVVVGGWVPRFLFPEAKTPHIGTMDIDLALDFRSIPDDTYQTLLKALLGTGYRQDNGQPFRFYRDVPVNGRSIVVVVDLLAGEYGGTGKSHRTQVVQDVRARKARGCDLAFENKVKAPLEGRLPGGAIERVTVRVAGIVPFLAMKGMAMASRVKEKDSYDIVYCIENYPGRTQVLAEEFRPHLTHGLVMEGLQKIRSKFLSPDHWGPVAYASFLQVPEGEARAIERRRAYEVVSSFLDSLEVLPWDD